MTASEFKSLKESPAQLPPLLQAMWHDSQGDWKKAHQLTQEVETKEGSWVHAYLHRKEGDLSNASYWYSRAGRKVSPLTLEEEWYEIVTALLNR